MVLEKCQTFLQLTFLGHILTIFVSTDSMSFIGRSIVNSISVFVNEKRKLTKEQVIAMAEQVYLKTHNRKTLPENVSLVLKSKRKTKMNNKVWVYKCEVQVK